MKHLRANHFHILSSVLIAVLTSVTGQGSAQCDGRNACELSKDNTECTVTNMEAALSQCCPVGSCNATGRQTGMLDPGSLDVRINYTAPMKANIIVTWNYKTGGAAPVPLQISVTQLSNSVLGLESLCLCLPQGVTRFVTPLHYPRQVCQRAQAHSLKVQLLANHVQVLIESQAVTASKEVTLLDCWTTMGKISPDVCGPAIPSPPQQVSAIVTQAGSESTTIQVTWDPPKDGDDPIIAYVVDLRTNLLLSPSSLIVPRNVTTYSFVFAHSITPASDPIILVRAGVRWNTFFLTSCQCCLRINRGEDQYVFGQASNSSVEWPEQQSTEDHKLAIIAATSVGTCATIIVIILVGVIIVAMVIRSRCKWHTTRHSAKDRERLVTASKSVV